MTYQEHANDINKTTATDLLGYGSKLCPVCQKNEVVWAAKCKSCYSKVHYEKNRDKIKAQAKKRYHDLVKPKAEARAKEPLVIHLHIHVHLEKE